MFKHRRIDAQFRSTFVFAMVAVLCAIASAQKGPASTTGAPLKGVDVKLGKNPGGSPAARTTNEKGEFNFGIVPAGKYDLIVSPPTVTETSAGAAGVKLDSSMLKKLAIAIDGVKGGPIKRDLDFKEKRADASQRTGKPKYQDISFTVESDGKSEVKGIITARAVNNPGVK